VHARISQDCNPADVKKLENKITDLKNKCQEKEKKKNDKLAELEKTKEALLAFDEGAKELADWLEEMIGTLRGQDPPSPSTDELKEQLQQHNQFTDDVQEEGEEQFKQLLRRAHSLKADMLNNDKLLNDKVQCREVQYL